MRQSWEHLCFLHWPVPVESVRALVPPGLSVDRFDGAAWVGVVPFTMTGVRLRGLPAIPGTGRFHELNVRTYVTRAGQAGVWFFSLDAASRLAVWVARRWFHLNYVWARMSLDIEGDAVRYASRRRRAADPAAELRLRYRPVGPAAPPAPGTLEHFLTERYCLFAESRRGGLYRGDIRHDPWPLQPAEAEIEINTMATAAGLTLPDRPPLAHFARRVDMVASPPVRVA